MAVSNLNDMRRRFTNTRDIAHLLAAVSEALEAMLLLYENRSKKTGPLDENTIYESLGYPDNWDTIKKGLQYHGLIDILRDQWYITAKGISILEHLGV